MSEWLDVIAHPPKEGQWAIVLCDGWAQDMGEGKARHKLFKLTRFSMATAMCLGKDSEGWIEWGYSDRPREYRKGWPLARHVTHYIPISATFPDEETWPVPEWCTWNTPSGNYSNMFGRQF
jgi:hypothetical protein